MKKDITIKGKNYSTQAYLTVPDTEGKHPGIILIHEVWGLVDHIRNVADRLKDEGYVLLAPDLVSETGILEKINPNLLKEIFNPDTRLEAQKTLRAFMAPIQSPEFAMTTIQKLQDCFHFLKEHDSTTGKVAAIGFCFGGTYSFSLACHQKELSVAIVFYGHAPDNVLLPSINCPVYAFYGENDHNLTDSLGKLSSTLESLDKQFYYKIYPDAAHAFFNDTNPYSYKEKPAKDAWELTLKALLKHNQ